MAKEKGKLSQIRVRSMGDPGIDHESLQKCFKDYSQRDLGCFKLYQNLINVPFFLFPGDDSAVLFYELDPSCVLPITEVGEPKLGGNGSVKRIAIHHAHHNYDNVGKEHSSTYFAVKTLHFHSDDRFQKEVEALERLSTKPKYKSPDHLVPLELAYRHGDKCCLVFPWASGNLKEYWELHEKHASNHGHVVWFFKQCHGLALGLHRLHSPRSYARSATGNNSNIHTAEDILGDKYGRHGDVKPENILWFNNYNGDNDHLAICDFGSTEFNNLNTKSLVDANQVCGYSITYQPPDSHTDSKVGQKIDIWSLGCVFLEFVSWFLLGYGPTVEEFPKARMMANPESSNGIVRKDQFFQFVTARGGGGETLAKVNPGVIQWIEKLHDLHTCPDSIHEFLDLIQRRMLQPRAWDRSKSSDIRHQLLDIYQQCCNDHSYATAGHSKADREEVEDLRFHTSQHTDNQSSDLFPKVNDEMCTTAPSAAEFEKDIRDQSEVSNPRRHNFSNENETHNEGFVPAMPTHYTSGGTGSSNGLQQMITSDTTPCLTETGDIDVNPQNSTSEYPRVDAEREKFEDLAIMNMPPSTYNVSRDTIEKYSGAGEKAHTPIVRNPEEPREGNDSPRSDILIAGTSTETPSQCRNVERRTAFFERTKRVLDKTKKILALVSLKLRRPKRRTWD
ncbi:hypothetical protein FSST1_001340 [Fusarium sambucinum]